MNTKMDFNESAKLAERVGDSHDGILVSREMAARIHPEHGVDINHTFGFVDDCEKMFKQIEHLEAMIDGMIDWGCVFGQKNIRRLEAAKEHLDDLRSTVHHTYKYDDK